MVLRLWCERPSERHHVGAERIAVRLGAALEQWLREHPASFGAAGLAEAGTSELLRDKGSGRRAEWLGYALR